LATHSRSWAAFCSACHLGKDPDVRRLNSGDQVVSFSMATSETWRDKSSGERKGAHRMAQCRDLRRKPRQGRRTILQEGTGVYLKDQLQKRKWQDQSGADRYTTEVVLQRFRGELQLLDSRGGGEGRVSFPEEGLPAAQASTAPRPDAPSGKESDFRSKTTDYIGAAFLPRRACSHHERW
jgi:single-strand DNA-binding protein